MAFITKNSKPDSELLSLFIADGDLDAIGILFERYMHLTFGVALKYLKNRDDAKEATMAVFEKIISDLPTTLIREFKPWLYVVTKNHCLMALRKQKSINKHEKNWENNPDLIMESDTTLHPLDSDEGQQLSSALNECITKLKEDQRICIELFYLKSYCYQQIADELNLDLTKIKSYIQNGKRNLKICLESNAETSMYQ